MGTVGGTVGVGAVGAVAVGAVLDGLLGPVESVRVVGVLLLGDLTRAGEEVLHGGGQGLVCEPNDDSPAEQDGADGDSDEQGWDQNHNSHAEPEEREQDSSSEREDKNRRGEGSKESDRHSASESLGNQEGLL